MPKGNSIINIKDADKSTIVEESDVSIESEESYPPLYTSTELQDIVTFLNYNMKWLCLSTLCNVVLFSVILHRFIFKTTETDSILATCTIVFCDVILLLDVAASFIYINRETFARRRYVSARSKILTVFDLISLISIPLTLLPQQKNVTWIFGVNVICLGFRNYRVLTFFYILSKTAAHNTLPFLTFKYGLITFVVCHVYACIWMSLACFAKDESCESEFSWTLNLINADMVKDKTSYYLICILYSINTVTAVGLLGASIVNDAEQLVTISLLVVGLYIINGLFVGAFTSVQIENYRRHSVFATKLELISNNLSYESITRRLKRKINSFYIIFWKRQGALKRSELLEQMPAAIRIRVLLDKYWDALNQSSLLRDTDIAFKRALASVMFSEMYTAGEVIHAQDRVKHIMMYVARGSVQILSGDDTESTLLTFGMGSCIGDVSLIYSLRSPVQVISTSYSIIYCLRKRDLWKTAHDLQLLNQSDVIHEVLSRKIRVARIRYHYKHNPDLNSSSHEIGLEERSRIGMMFSRPVGKYHSTYIREEAISELYVINKEEVEVSHHDGIFVRTTFPWILRPNSDFLFAWECFFVVLVSIVAFFYPWQTMYYSTRTAVHYVFNCFIAMLYTVDFIFQMFTAIEDDKGLFTKFYELVAIKCSKLTFILDLVAIIPIDISLHHIKSYDASERFLVLNRLLVMYRIVVFIRRLENNFKVNVAVVRCIKYVTFLLYLAYIIGVIYFSVACVGTLCARNSWVDMYRQNFGGPTVYIFETSIMYAMQLISGTGGYIVYATLTDLMIITTVCILGALIFSYLVADYSATLTLAARSRFLYIEMIDVVRKFMTAVHMPANIQKRMTHYLEAQWVYNKGLTINKLLRDAPLYLYEEYQNAKYGALFNKVPLLQELDKDVITEIAAGCETLFFPPNEFVTYSREIVKEMYIIEKGFCEVISPASGRIEKVIGPESAFSAIDMLLELPGVFHVRSVTHVSVIKISYSVIKQALTTEEWRILEQLVEEIKQSFTVQRLFTESTAIMVDKIVEEDERSWVKPPGRLDARRKEYIRSWRVFRFCRYFMMPYTIMPCGKFLAYYEIWRATLAFISAITIPNSFVYQAYVDIFAFIAMFLDISAYVDIYIRMHVCFYNNKGILVTHPRVTAVNYLSSSFIVDFLGCFPTDYFLMFFWRNSFDEDEHYYKMHAILKLNRILQIYRIPDGFSLFTRDIMKSRKTAVLFIIMFSLSLALCNFVSSIFVLCTCTIKEERSIQGISDFSWFSHINVPFNLTVSGNIFIIAFYYVSCQALQIGFGDITAYTKDEIILVVIIIIVGYLWFTYVIVVVSNSNSTVNINLTLYQNHMKQLISFMKREKVNKDLQKKAIDYFEYVWQRTHGLLSGKILRQCHLALSKDCALHLYGDTLKQVPIFKDMVTSFYRVIGINLEELYFLRNDVIVQLNDIENNLYIVHKGQVNITGPDGSIFAILSKGSVFGNIDEVNCTRSMVTAKALTMVDLLCIKSETLYSLIYAYPVIVSRLRKHILLENLSYIESKYFSEEQDTILHTIDTMYIAGKKPQMSKRMKILSSREIRLFFMVTSLLSFICVTYQFSFQNYAYEHFGVSYFLDFMHIIKIYLGFVTPFRNSLGDIVTDRKTIVKRYLKPQRFYIELAGSLPTDVLYFVIPVQLRMRGLTLLRLNRMLRITIVYNYFSITHDYLNINVLAIKLSAIFTMITLLIHIQACIWFLVACPGECNINSWVFGPDGEPVCSNSYVCALYYAASLITFTGFETPHPRFIVEIVLTTLVLIVNKFILGLFIGSMTAIVHNVSSTLVRYDHSIRKLKEYLMHSKISEALVNVVLGYTHELWQRNNGIQIPAYLISCPHFLQQSIKHAAFGHHIYENTIFMACHSDFLRMLIRRLTMLTFFDGHIICYQGDVNDTMYFVHQGIVKVYKIKDNEEILVDELQELDSFGILQGLFNRIPHTHTFKASTVTVILTLTYSDWSYLMEFFPASKYSIYQKIKMLWENSD